MKKSAYTPLRSSTGGALSQYSAKPLPWWNRLRLYGGTQTKGTG